MSAIDPVLGAPRAPKAPTAPKSDDEKLRSTAHQMHGLFVEQLFKAMRETVPQDGALSGGSGEEMFTGLMDSHLAAETPTQWERGLGEAIYRQLRAATGGAAASDQPTTTNAPAMTPGEDRR